MTVKPGNSGAVDIFDVTIRDGSYVVDFQFRKEDVRLLYGALDRSGFRYIEVGHGLGLNASALKGRAAASDDEYLAAAASVCSRSRFGAFFIPGIGDREHLRRARQTYGMHFVRIGNEPEKAEHMVPYVAYAKELGYEVMCNFMKSYTVTPVELARKAKVLAAAGADAVYLVDSAGGMFPSEVAQYVRALAGECDARIGFHGHNNLELGVSNALSAWENGCTLIDCSIGGLGRGGGNTRTELFIPVLKALGVALPYDYLEVLRVWQELIRPIMRRRPVTAEDVVSGYARVHSGMMGPFHEACRKHKVDRVSLLCAYGDAVHGGREGVTPAGLAAELAASRPLPRPVPRGRRFSLLDMAANLSDPHTIRNSCRSVAEVLHAVNVLSRKAYLPVVLLAHVDAVVSSDPGVVAEYVYHDEHFIVLRASFGSLGSFAEIMEKFRGCFNIVVFEGITQSVRTELQATEEQWRLDETVLWVDLTALKLHHLFAVINHVAAETGFEQVFLFGVAPEQVADSLPPGLERLRICCIASGDHSLRDISLLAPDPVHGAYNVKPADPATSFEIVVLLAPANTDEVEATLARMSPAGVILDCLGETSQHAELLKNQAQRVRSIPLGRALSGAVLNLLSSGVGQRRGAGKTGGTEGSRRMDDGRGLRAA